MKYVAPFVLILIGVIIGVISAIFQLFFAILGVGFNLLGQLFSQESSKGFGSLIEALGIWDMVSLILPLIGICISLALIYYIVKFAREPSKKDGIVTIVLGSVGTFLGMTLGGIIVLVGGIVGIIQIGKNKENAN